METVETKPTADKKLKKIKYPVCRIGILFEVDQIDKGIIRGKCSKCKSFAVYDAVTGDCKTVERTR